METTPDKWCTWYVSLDYVTKALAQLKSAGVTEYHLLPCPPDKNNFQASDFVLFYYNRPEYHP